jgi:hypothetical protein
VLDGDVKRMIFQDLKGGSRDSMPVRTVVFLCTRSGADPSKEIAYRSARVLCLSNAGGLRSISHSSCNFSQVCRTSLLVTSRCFGPGSFPPARGHETRVTEALMR